MTRIKIVVFAGLIALALGLGGCVAVPGGYYGGGGGWGYPSYGYAYPAYGGGYWAPYHADWNRGYWDHGAWGAGMHGYRGFDVAHGRGFGGGWAGGRAMTARNYAGAILPVATLLVATLPAAPERFANIDKLSAYSGR